MKFQLLRSLRIVIATLFVLLIATSASGAKDKDKNDPGSNGQGQENRSENASSNNGKSEAEVQGSASEGNSRGNGNNDSNESGTGENSTQTPGNVPPSSAIGIPSASDQDVALEAVQDSRAVPLEAIVEQVHQTTGGEIIDAQLVTVRGFLLYEIKVVEAGTVTVLHYYARSGLPVAD